MRRGERVGARKSHAWRAMQLEQVTRAYFTPELEKRVIRGGRDGISAQKREKGFPYRFTSDER